MTIKRLDPKKYPNFYKNGGYSFLPQSLIDDFREQVSNELQKRRSHWLEETQELERTWRDIDNPYESFKDMCYCEARSDEVDELLFLLDELVILSLYRHIEIERKRVLIERFPFIDKSKMSNFKYLSGILPFLKNLIWFRGN